MVTYIAFLRGVNVGGKNRIKMTELRQALAAAGLARVETYIQSGNIVFEVAGSDAELRQLIERLLAERFDVATTVILRTAAELARLVAACPFTSAEIAEAEAVNNEGESCYVALLAAAPTADELAALEHFTSKDDRLAIRGRDLYLLLGHSIRNSRLAGSLQRLAQPATLRNWQTINQLVAMARSRTDE
jgi:uncharacterized protein (DUF1697 family)